jgi:hypothetical protein
MKNEEEKNGTGGIVKTARTFALSSSSFISGTLYGKR